MASKQLTLLVRPRGKPVPNLPEEIPISNLDSTAQLHTSIANASKFSTHRLRITKGSDGSLVPNDKGTSVDSTGLRDRSTIYVKDLGPQISWRTVFLIEYLGPLLIHPLILFARPYLYRNPTRNPLAKNQFPPPSDLQTLTCALVVVHFVKRELETLLVHRFSSATMPFRNVFKNSAHYWLLSGILIAYFAYSPTASAATQATSITSPIPLLGLALFAIGELGNLNAHLVLRGLRSSGGTERGIPHGLGFNWVTCPNYLFETIAWIGIWIVSRNWTVGAFLVFAVGQMAIWAKKKEGRYRREFGDKYKRKRYAILPGIY